MSALKIAVLFPGQGSQYVGMGREFLEADAEAEKLMATAEAASGLPLRRLCLEGPLDELTRVVNLQPALTAINLICWQALAREGIKPAFLAGHSLGEYSALHAAGVLSLKDTLALVTERGRLMEREGGKNPGAMLAILGLRLEQVEELLAAAGGGTICVANHNSAQQVVISGEAEPLARAAVAAAQKGAKTIPLKVSVANHSPLVKDAVPDFDRFMAAIDFAPPAVEVLFNVTAAAETDPAAIRRIMARQIASRVRWYELIMKLVASGVRIFIEVGPKTVLTGLLKKIVPKDYECQRLQVESSATLAQTLAALR